MKIKPKSKAIVAALVAASLTLGVFAADSHWYFKKTADHSAPPIPSEFSYITELGGYYLVPTDERVIYLTFDAGYENGNVERILDTLKKHNAVGCFFILSHLIEANTELVKRMFDEGHTVGNHTMKHKNMAKCGTREFFESELHGLESLCLELTGHEPSKLYRPPEGSFSRENLEITNDMGYKTIFWSYAYADWDNEKQPDPKVSMQKLLDHTHPGEILLLHPTSATNAEILDDYLTELEAQGYRFGSLEELFSS